MGQTIETGRWPCRSAEFEQLHSEIALQGSVPIEPGKLAWPWVDFASPKIADLNISISNLLDWIQFMCSKWLHQASSWHWVGLKTAFSGYECIQRGTLRLSLIFLCLIRWSGRSPDQRLRFEGLRRPWISERRQERRPCSWAAGLSYVGSKTGHSRSTRLSLGWSMHPSSNLFGLVALNSAYLRHLQRIAEEIRKVNYAYFVFEKVQMALWWPSASSMDFGCDQRSAQIHLRPSRSIVRRTMRCHLAHRMVSCCYWDINFPWLPGPSCPWLTPVE